jgi:hypothetical protein
MQAKHNPQFRGVWQASAKQPNFEQGELKRLKMEVWPHIRAKFPNPPSMPRTYSATAAVFMTVLPWGCDRSCSSLRWPLRPDFEVCGIPRLKRETWGTPAELDQKRSSAEGP